MKHVIHNIEQAREVFKTIDWSVSKEINVKDFKPKKSPKQKGLFHAWIDEITDWLNQAHVNVSRRVVQELVKQQFGPKVEFLGHDLLVSTEDYDWDSMSDMLSEIQVWAATDLNLELKVKKGVLHGKIHKEKVQTT